MVQESEETKEQLRKAFQELGLNTEMIRYNPNLDRYRINIDAEGTDDQYLEGVGEIGSSGPVDVKVDTTKLRQIVRQIEEMEIPAGQVNVVDTMRDEHFLLNIQK